MKSPKVDKKLEHANAIIGGIVRDIRKERKIQQTVLCKALGLDQSALSRVENGRQVLTAAQWVLFCRTMGVMGDGLANRVNQEMSA